MSYVINALIFCQCLSREKTLLGALIKWFADISADDRKELSQWGGIRVEVVPKCFRKTVQKFEWTGTFRGYFDPTNYVYGRAFRKLFGDPVPSYFKGCCDVKLGDFLEGALGAVWTLLVHAPLECPPGSSEALKRIREEIETAVISSMHGVWED